MYWYGTFSFVLWLYQTDKKRAPARRRSETDTVLQSYVLSMAMALWCVHPLTSKEPRNAGQQVAPPVRGPSDHQHVLGCCKYYNIRFLLNCALPSAKILPLLLSYVFAHSCWELTNSMFYTDAIICLGGLNRYILYQHPQCLTSSACADSHPSVNVLSFVLTHSRERDKEITANTAFSLEMWNRKNN